MNPCTHMVRAGVLAAVLVKACSVAGCTGHQAQDHSTGAQRQTTAPPTPNARTADAPSPQPSFSKQPLTAWPDKPFTNSAPFHWDGEPAAIAAGYAAADFRVQMRNTWHLSLRKHSEEEDLQRNALPDLHR